MNMACLQHAVKRQRTLERYTFSSPNIRSSLAAAKGVKGLEGVVRHKGMEPTPCSVRRAPAFGRDSCAVVGLSSTGVGRRYASNSDHWQSSVCISYTLAEESIAAPQSEQGKTDASSEGWVDDTVT
jgi:hypothetical protein